MDDLWEASIRGNLTGIRRSINLYGAKKLNEYDSKGITPLFLATSENKFDAVDLLVTNGADVNLRSKGGYTPLMIAASEGHVQILHYLLDHHADINLTNDNGWSALICATSFNHIQCAEKLLSIPNIEIDRCSKTGCSALYFAAREGYSTIVQVLIAHGANVNITSLSGYTPLHIAAEQGHANVVDILLDARADPTLTDQSGKNAWQIAKNDEIRDRLYTKMLKRAIKSQPSFLVDIPTDVDSLSQNMTQNEDQPVTLSTATTPLLSPMFLTAQQQLSLAHFASMATSDVLSYLSQFGHQQQYQRHTMDFILQHPPLTDFYLYFHRSVSTTILGFQTLFSKLVVDNRSSQTEEIAGLLDSLAQSSNIAAFPLITGIVKELVKLPNDIHREHVLNHVTKCFPSVESHRYLEELSRELTMEEMHIIEQTFRLTKTATKRNAIIQIVQAAAGWFYENLVLRGEESEYYSMNPVQVLAMTYASRLLDRLIILPTKQTNKNTKKDQSLTPELSISTPIQENDIPVLKCYALGLESLAEYQDYRQKQDEQAKQGTSNELDRSNSPVVHRVGATHNKPLPSLPPSSSIAATTTVRPQTLVSTPPAKPARNRGSISPGTTLSSSAKDNADYMTNPTTSQSAPASLKTSHTTADPEVGVDDASISMLQHRLAILETSLNQDQVQQQSQLQSLTQEIQRLRTIVHQQKLIHQDKRHDVGGSSSSGGLIQSQIQRNKQDQQNEQDSNNDYSTSPQYLQQEQRIATYESLLQTMIAQLQVVQEDLQSLQHLSGIPPSSFSTISSPNSASASPTTVSRPTTDARNSFPQQSSPPAVSILTLTLTDGAHRSNNAGMMPGVDPGADDSVSSNLNHTEVAVVVPPEHVGCTCLLS